MPAETFFTGVDRERMSALPAGSTARIGGGQMMDFAGSTARLRRMDEYRNDNNAWFSFFENRQT
jgi:hypothetical protein